MRLLFLLYFLTLNCLVLAHEGHHKTESAFENVQDSEELDLSWTEWIGSYHLVFLHFPIALINMLAISECLFAWYRKPIFEFSSRFMLISAAIISPFTALLGLIYSYAVSYEGLMKTFLTWHMWFGISTAILTIALALIREQMGISKLYYVCLVLLVLMINITASFGGGMSFGTSYMHPPLEL